MYDLFLLLYLLAIIVFVVIFDIAIIRIKRDPERALRIAKQLGIKL